MRLLLGLLAVAAVSGAASAKPALPVITPAPVPVAPPSDPRNILHLDLSTGGSVVILLRPDKAPNSVERIRTLTRAGFYDNVLFHRVIEGFMAQTGDPKGTGEGGSPLPDVKAEFNDLPHLRGAVSMARPQDINGANSQFFIVLMPVLRLDGKYTVIGRATSGMEYVDAIARGEPPANPSKIVRAFMESDGPTAPRVALVIPAPVAAAAPATPATIPAPIEAKAPVPQAAPQAHPASPAPASPAPASPAPTPPK
ncbi:peptidylprolyl isomerase [Sphingomonas sp.]|uniref:peptidylprolyl isomerase n=1 Tax=Sphingomonas sp. TaxID=28214 RepID=UPI0025CE7488|nr:peptidylprolyl isomerase [Sphingomonas sp.]